MSNNELIEDFLVDNLLSIDQIRVAAEKRNKSLKAVIPLFLFCRGLMVGLVLGALFFWVLTGNHAWVLQVFSAGFGFAAANYVLKGFRQDFADNVKQIESITSENGAQISIAKEIKKASA